MFVGFIYAIAACAVWGLVFVVPAFMSGFTSVEVVLCRYLTYGLFSTILLLSHGFQFIKRYSLKMVGKALLFALLSNMFFYFGVVAGLRFASPSLTVLIIGLAPIVIVLYGNWHVREISYKHLILPCIWIFLGMVLVNVAEVDWSFKEYSPQQYFVGLFGVFIALISWSLYVVHNARFLKKNPHVPPTEWATLLGVVTFVLTILMVLFFVYGIDQGVHVKELFMPTRAVLIFWVCAAILGLGCSWLGGLLWNKASLYLPVSLMGPMMIFETLFGLIYVYLADWSLPTLWESIGIVSMVGGTVLSIYIFKKRQFSP